MLKQLREFFQTNILNVGTLFLVDIGNLKSIIEIILFIALITYNVLKIKQLIKTSKEKKKHGTKTENQT